MDPFWKTFCEDVKDRGRDATPFLVTLAALAGLCIAIGIVGETQLVGFIMPASFCAGVFVMIWAFVMFWRTRNRRRETGERRELSSDELRVARSKLKSGLNGFKSVRPVIRPPDTDLKI